MNKKNFFPLLMLLISLSAFAQNELTFSVKYAPETTYFQTISQTGKNSIAYSGSADLLKILKDKGMENPTVTSTNSVSEIVQKMGKLNAENQFPLTMEYLKSPSVNGKKVIPDGTIIYGRGSTDKMPTLDSIASNEIDAELKASLLQTMQSTFSQISFPVKTLKIGESFTQKIPLNIPVAGQNIEMEIVTRYKLISIANGFGNFDMTQEYKMKSKIMDSKIKATGKGKGKIVYDIQKKFFQRFETASQIEMEFKMDDFKMIIKSDSDMVQEVKITQGQ